MWKFKKRALKVTMIEDIPANITMSAPVDYEKLIWTVVKGSALVVGVYVGADTVRQIALEMVKPL